MDTSEAAESRPQNPDDEYNFADYDDEGSTACTMQIGMIF